MKEIILLKYGELALKGANRSAFESVLVKNIRRRLQDLGPAAVEKSQSTITVTPLQEGFDIAEAFDRLSRVYGIAAMSRSIQTEKDFAAICAAADRLDAELSRARTFKVNAKRSDKKFPMDSPAICRELGAYLLRRHPHLKVDVREPELVVWAEVRDRCAYVHAGQRPGAGGIPVGSGGKAALLLSGGIDSPVAGAMIAKRGLEIMAVHFASPPYTSERAKLKVMALCRKMAAWTGRIRLVVVGFTEIQEEIGRCCPEEYFTLVMRRLMMEIAGRIAAQYGAEALVTGESLGQVASQTVQALACTDAASPLPVLRPCIGLDKEEIVAVARKIDTFETSILPYEDCCTVFTPRHPRTHPSLPLVEQAESGLDREALIARAMQSPEVLWIDEHTEFERV